MRSIQVKEINEKLDRISEDMVEMKISQVRMEADVKEHMKRTEMAEENIQILRKEFQPIKRRDELVNLSAKIISVCAAILIFLKEMGWLSKIL